MSIFLHQIYFESVTFSGNSCLATILVILYPWALRLVYEEDLFGISFHLEYRQIWRADTESYVGLARNFKKRYAKHKATLTSRHADGQTTLSNFVWEQTDEGKDPKISWKFLERNLPDFNPITGNCHLCTKEKFQIVLNPSVATLNHRTEIFSCCRHRSTFLIGDPPD